ncbi:hypothetical protein A2V56_02870 [Candidatus Woesebacteria bacterium RBG_19FT_COMBO_42_9]|uniref:Glycosidase n=1 Tax=Candidatus Woesebacteria bacterium RBG_16_42_24 TaxID=1802485 RepID=A0A1F7XK97_9BACT|nr:MAG: hypothetical protein A2V97_02290 [Candidatus Woesebacteria bacterium RBG_16_42_24]OGM16262.1 MAG: hypothetical protein A2V56_02870 [Candidatus Woesebacteria bacterium RBG_19FT_COMBO_42_9]OGM67083.1 MAG: hypothetical protein A2985_02385 [Candidatus Woesebacteria bacterium RIFCSPLOWO2_01_FULL_43_11]
MVKLIRHPNNPLLTPDRNNEWESSAVYNPSVAKIGDKYVMVYRAFDSNGKSTVGLAEGSSPTSFLKRRLFIKPENNWEEFGCEDPRVVKVEDKYFISYTAISTWPPTIEGIKVGMAITTDFSKVEVKHPVTTFNSKALGFFSEKINGKYAAILAADTDKKPPKIALAYFDKKEDIWSETYWNDWYSHIDGHVFNIPKRDEDHFEVGAAPVKTQSGWLLIYSYIENYFTGSQGWRIEAVLLDPVDPFKILGRTQEPLLYPIEDYEIYGNVHNIVFPSGALIEGDDLFVYYGGADTVSCVASCKVKDLVADISGKL